METRGRKRKDPPSARVFQAMAFLLEDGKAHSVREAAFLAVEILKLQPDGSTLASLIDRLRKRFKEQEPQLRERAKAYLQQPKKIKPSPIAPSIGVGSGLPAKSRRGL